MVYLIYTFVAINSNDYFTGAHTYTPSAPSPTGSYSFDVANNAGENYVNFGTNKIVMKGFLASYKIKQGNSPGLSINFTLAIKNATYFTVTLDTYATSTIE